MSSSTTLGLAWKCALNLPCCMEVENTVLRKPKGSPFDDRTSNHMIPHRVSTVQRLERRSREVSKPRTRSNQYCHLQVKNKHLGNKSGRMLDDICDRKACNLARDGMAGHRHARKTTAGRRKHHSCAFRRTCHICVSVKTC